MSLTTNAFGDDLSKAAVSDIAQVKPAKIQVTQAKKDDKAAPVGAILVDGAPIGDDDSRLFEQLKESAHKSLAYTFLFALRTLSPTTETALYHTMMIEDLDSIKNSLKVLSSQKSSHVYSDHQASKTHVEDCDTHDCKQKQAIAAFVKHLHFKELNTAGASDDK